MMNLIVEGFEEPGGYCEELEHEIITRMFIKNDTVNWRRFCIPKMYIAMPAHMLLLQGMPNAQLFLATSLEEPSRFYKGPLLFIRGKLSEPWEVPAYFTELVLGQILKAPDDKGISLLEVMAGCHIHEGKRTLKKGS